MYVPDMSAPAGADGGPADAVTAWRPDVPGIAEVLHARFTRHAYPAHVHSTWTLLIVDDGAVRYDLDRHPHGTAESPVTLLPPGVPHDGRDATGHGFRKRVLYLEPDVLGPEVLGRDGTGTAVDRPGLDDPALRDRLDALHHALTTPGAALHAQSRFAFVVQRLAGHLAVGPGTRPGPVGPGTGDPTKPDPRLADRLRQLLDASIRPGLTLDEAARVLHAHPTHLVRTFSREFGIPPHRYLDGRRVDLARRLLLGGAAPADAAQAAGFYDQAHLTRRFARTLGVTPARYAAGGRSAGGGGRSAGGRAAGWVIGGAAPSEARTRLRARR